MLTVFRSLLVTAVLLIAPAWASAEFWTSLEGYVRECVLIVRCKTEINGRAVKLRVLESWKGEYHPELFDPKPPEGYIFADTNHGAGEPVDGRELIFFFTKHNQPEGPNGKLRTHSTCFQVKDGKLVYAATCRRGLRQEFTVAAFKTEIRAFVEKHEAAAKTAGAQKGDE